MCIRPAPGGNAKDSPTGPGSGRLTSILSGLTLWALALTARAEATNEFPAAVMQTAALALAVDQGPRIDGRFDEVCWRLAPPLTNFTQVLPVEGTAPTERTEVRFVYTRDCLYAAIRCYDSAPRQIIARQMQRDSDFDPDDFALLAFDTFNRRHDGYYFAVNPAGARSDGLIQNFSDRKSEWDGIWDVRTQVDEMGWTAEIAIPFKSLSFNPNHDTWGCNVERVIRRKQETDRWTALSRAKSATTLSDFGELRGLLGMRQGHGFELRPFLSLKYVNDAVANNEDWKFRPGGDVTCRITPSLTANATFNTDFAEAEVDDRVVNLTRFPVFFPEKRDFFLQDSSLFVFGGMDGSPTPYYSRRIGLSASGESVDIIAGGRLTGRVGSTQIALLDVQQDDYDGVPSKNLFVGRATTKVFEESNVGVITTHGDPRSEGDNLLIGLDFNYLNSRLAGSRQLVGHAWFMGTDSDQAGGRDAALGGVLEFPNEPFSARAEARQFGDKFDPALGFVPRTGVREYLGDAGYVWRPNAELLRSFEIRTHWEFTTDFDSRIVAEDNDICVLEFASPAEDEIELQYGSDRDVLEAPFEIQPGIIIPPGDYWDGHFKVTLSTSEARKVSGFFSYRNGGFYTGDKQDYIGEAAWRPSRHLTIGAGYQLTEVRLPEGDFEVHIFSGQLNLGFTPDLTWSSRVQYDNVSDDFGVNSRVRWTWEPGNDVFFVVNQGWDVEDWRFEQLQTEVTLKVGATFRF